jgi:hypothetical protein
VRVSIVILQGDAEASLFGQAGAILQACFPHVRVDVHHAWTTRSDLLRDAGAPALGRDPATGKSAAEWLAEHHDLVVLSTLPDVALPLLRGPDGPFVAHRTLAAGWSDEQRAAVARSSDEGYIDLDRAVEALAGVVDDLQGRGQAVAICNVFRHVAEPPRHKADGVSLRDRIRAMNRNVARLSHRAGCFVLDVDRVLANEGGRALGADYAGGGDRASELALEELVALVLEAIPSVSAEAS